MNNNQYLTPSIPFAEPLVRLEYSDSIQYFITVMNEFFFIDFAGKINFFLRNPGEGAIVSDILEW